VPRSNPSRRRTRLRPIWRRRARRRGSTVGPTAEPTAGAAEPSPAASGATDPSASPSAATTSTSAPSASAGPSDGTSASSAALDALAAVPAQVEDAATKELRTAAAKVAALTDEVTQAVRDQQAAADASAEADAEAARSAAEQAATRSAQRVSLDQYANGQIPASALCPLSFATGAELRCDATAAIEQLNVAYRQKFGTDLVISDSYRSLSSQFACRRTKGSLCAVPGTSNHGLGKAVDLGGGAQYFGTTQHNWLVANAGAYGWALPAWAHAGGSKPEPWHWEFVD
jgi:LAS superfamily LD-carboxypeptidase LdcB